MLNLSCRAVLSVDVFSAGLLWVLPANESPPQDGTKSIMLQPGFGWGEGSHPSTYMCLQYICDEVCLSEHQPS
jgi:ribosomal protein L11 methylase PrmA